MIKRNISKEIREKISKSLKKYFSNKENRKKLSEVHKGKKLSEEHKQKIRESCLRWNREIGMSQEIRKRIAEKQKGKIISEETRRRISEANKGHTGGWNKGLTKEDSRVRKNIENASQTRRRLYKEGKLKPWNLGKPWSKEVKTKISSRRAGKTYEEIMGKEKALQFKKELSEIMKKRVRGKNNPMYGRTGERNPHFGKPAEHGKNSFRADLGHSCHSKWEANYCRFLLWRGRKYQYEPKTFVIVLSDGTKASYTPDFLIDNKEWHELKGWEDRSKIKKWEIFQQQYLNEKFILINRDNYKKIERLYQYIIPNWEF